MKVAEFIESTKNAEMLSAFCKARTYLNRYDRPQCSISGGADSDTMLDLIFLADDKKKTQYVFFDTGIEYEATKKHLDYLEKKYGIEILRRRAIEPVPYACKKYGVPFMNKFVSEMIQRLQKHKFKWEDKPFEELLEEYPRCKIALKWWCNMHGKNSRFNIDHHKALKEFMVTYPPDFPISNRCCDKSKKDLAKQIVKDNDNDLVIIGIRKAEGGVRSTAYDSCFSESSKGKVANFRPLFWVTNADKEEYENDRNITHSECYTRYGLKRTGCAGCPFGRDFEKELEVIEKYEPKLYKAVNNIFGKSYV